MTDREKAIVMAYTGVTMLTGDKLSIFYKYIEELLGHPIMTHELADQDIQDEITRKSKEDFVALCKDDSAAECDTNDLISRKAAIDALGKCPEAEWEEGWVAAPTGEYKQWLFAYNAILSTPSICAVPLDKLCEWLAENALDITRRNITPLKEDAEHWRKLITKYMEGLDAN